MSSTIREYRPVIDRPHSKRCVSTIFVVATLGAAFAFGIGNVATGAEQEVARRHSLIQRPTVEPVSPRSSTEHIVPNGQVISPLPAPIEPTPLHRKLTKRPTAVIALPAVSEPSPHASRLAATTTSPAAQTTSIGIEHPPANSATQKSPVRPAASAVAGLTVPTMPMPVTQTTGVIPLAGALGMNGVAAAGGNGSGGKGGSRSASNLLRSSSIARLLQPVTPTVTTPPAPVPPSSQPVSQTPTSPPSTSPTQPTPTTGSATLSWGSNNEPDLAGYKIYIGTTSGVYSYPGSPFTVGSVTTYTVTNLPSGSTYFFAISAYDSAGNESSRSAEASKSIY